MKKITERSILRKIMLPICLFIAATLAFLCGCARTAQGVLDAQSAPQPATSKPEATQPAQATIEQATAKKAAELPAAKPDEVREAVARSCQNAVAMEGARYIVGDFNGDGSQDIAVVVKPVNGMLPKINSEFAVWALEDPRQVHAPDITKSIQKLPPKPKPARAVEGDILLAIIHGKGDKGWRDSVMNGVHLLKNAVGGDMTAQGLRESLRMVRNQEKPLALKGDIIKERLEGESGFLFWTGAAYAWQSLNQTGAANDQSKAR
jgi:hypothetical protein